MAAGTLKSYRGKTGASGLLSAVDVGTTKVVSVTAEPQEDGVLRMVGVGVVPSRGLQKGTVVDVEACTQAIRSSVQEAERTSGTPIERALVGISGVQMAGVNSRGSTAVARAGRGVERDDIERALLAAQTIAIPYNYEILHAIPHSYTLDGQDGIKNPLGMYGSRLEVEAHLVTTAASASHTLVKCVRNAGVEVDLLVLESLASGEAVLTREERESGVVLVDIGGGTTNVAVFLDGSVWHSAVIGIGGQLVTNDLVICLQMPFAVAEELKLKHGSAESAEISEHDMVEIHGFGEQAARSVPRQLVAQIIEARIGQIFSLVAKEIKRSGYSGLLPAGVVLCGGTARLAGMRSAGKRMLGMPTRIGAPQGVRGLVDVTSSPAYACAVGLLRWEPSETDEPRQGRGSRGGGWSDKLKELLGRLLPG